MDIVRNVHRVCEFQQGNVCPILDDVEVGVCDDLAHIHQVVMVIEVLLTELYSDLVGVSNIPKEKRYSFRRPVSLPETQRWCVMIPSYPTLLPIPIFWPWRSPALGHIKFDCPMGRTSDQFPL